MVWADQAKHAPWVAGYLGIQGFLVALWWGLLLAWPDLRVWFEPSGRPEILDAFWLGDGVLLCVGSLLAAFGVARGAPWAPAVTWIVLGGFAYATLYCAGLVLHAGAPWWPVVTMAPACVATAVCAARA